jgi:hypothetical protein
MSKTIDRKQVASDSDLDGRRLDFSDKPESNLTEQFFLLVHVTILRALYADTAKPSLEAPPFRTIQDFVNNRERLLKAKEVTLHLKGVYDQALQVSEAEKRKPQQSSTGDQTLSRKRKSTSPRHASTMLSLSMHSPLSLMHSEKTKEPFGLVARLLHLRYTSSYQQFQQETDQYKELFEATKQEIASVEQALLLARSKLDEQTSGTLERLLSTNNGFLELDATYKKLSGSDSKVHSQLIELTYKVKLWKLLAHDLKQLLLD